MSNADLSELKRRLSGARDFTNPSGTAMRDLLAKACDMGKVEYSTNSGPARITIECDEDPPVRIEFNSDGSLEGVYVCHHLVD